ncbi:MAG: glycosyltransferase family 2 protein [bacterium]|nr:glycosyltransferase family 2 protein [bacterium]
MKFSIVTPVYNGQKYIAETIESVLSQEGDFEIEYIIEDGGSTDGTTEIIKSYAEKVSSGSFPLKCRGVSLKWTSEKDRGMYDAINKGFTKATGDIYAWINSDDTYLPEAFAKISAVFSHFAEVSWLKGITSFRFEDENKDEPGICYIYNRKWIAKGIYGRYTYFIHQDSVFWRRELWRKIGSVPDKYKLAGDYYLWIEFAKRAKLWSLNSTVSRFRKNKGQLTDNMKKYRDEQSDISKKGGILPFFVKLFFYGKSKLGWKIFDPVFSFLYTLMFPNRNKFFIELNEKKAYQIKKTDSYIAR